MILTTMIPIAMELRQIWDRSPEQQPSFVTIASSIPGRLRLRMPERRGDEGYALQIEQALAALPGVTRVSANPVTAGVLVLFDPKQLEAQQIMAELEQRGLLGQRLPAPPAGAPAFGEVAARVGTAVAKELAKAALAEVIGEMWFAPLLALL